MRAVFDSLSQQEETIATNVVDSAYAVHKRLGPGLLESVYEPCFCHQLRRRGHEVECQVKVPRVYDNRRFVKAFQLDVLIDDLVICEVKAVLEMHAVFEAQLLTYLKLTDRRLGFLINFNARRIKEGIQRLIR